MYYSNRKVLVKVMSCQTSSPIRKCGYLLLKLSFLCCWTLLGLSLILHHHGDKPLSKRSTNFIQRTLKDKIQIVNNEQKVRNSNLLAWPPASDNANEFWPEGIVVAIQVNDRIDYLKKLIESLSRAKWISRALIIFSHNVDSEEIDRVVQSIRFAPVMQIYFPYSIQLYPSTFPGDSPSDCPRNIEKSKAVEIGCFNAKSPDMYGHYREAPFCQMKHHWWWKANFIFQHVRILENYHGQVLFMEEDHFVADDFLHVLWLQSQLMNGRSDCPQCNQARILSLGTYNQALTSSQFKKPQGVDLTEWSSAQHNMGMSFNRSFWNDIHRCSESFCSIDDYNWDWSLAHVAKFCLPFLKDDFVGQLPKEKKSYTSKFVLSALVFKTPRVYHIGQCGFHQVNKKSCTTNDSNNTLSMLRKVEELLQLARHDRSLFPISLRVNHRLANRFISLAPKNGGWADPRDRMLCLSFSSLPDSAIEQNLHKKPF